MNDKPPGDGPDTRSDSSEFDSSEFAAMRREHSDPDERIRPLPWFFTMFLGAIGMWGAFYIATTPSGEASAYGDQRTVALLRPRRHHTRRRADCQKRAGTLRDARLQREHPAIDARQGRTEAAVIGIEYGGGFGHRRTRGVNRSRTNSALAFLVNANVSWKCC